MINTKNVNGIGDLSNFLGMLKRDKEYDNIIKYTRKEWGK